jgi:hypothetical protein
VVTWPELRALGALAWRTAGGWTFEAPEGVDAQVVAAIHARAPMMARPPRLQVPPGFCDACGGGLGGRCTGGWCPLCGAGRQVALRTPEACTSTARVA